MIRRYQPTAPGQKVTISSEYWTDAFLVAKDRGQTLREVIETAIRNEKAAHDQLVAHNAWRNEWRERNGTSIPRPMQSPAKNR